MRKIKINPKYEYLRAFLESIPDIFEKEGREIFVFRIYLNLSHSYSDSLK